MFSPTSSRIKAHQVVYLLRKGKLFPNAEYDYGILFCNMTNKNVNCGTFKICLGTNLLLIITDVFLRAALFTYFVFLKT